jgi:hypothetical protein
MNGEVLIRHTLAVGGRRAKTTGNVVAALDGKGGNHIPIVEIMRLRVKGRVTGKPDLTWQVVRAFIPGSRKTGAKTSESRWLDPNQRMWAEHVLTTQVLASRISDDHFGNFGTHPFFTSSLISAVLRVWNQGAGWNS